MNAIMCIADVALSPLESERFEKGANTLDDVLYTTSNSWMEVNYTQLVANARIVLPRIKEGSIPLAMVKVWPSTLHSHAHA